MEAGKRNIKSGITYDHLFPKARLRDTKVKRGAVLEDTIDFIPIAVKRTKWQTQEYVDQELRGLSVYDACEKLWHFLYNHIQYKKDKEGREQIRSPGRSWHDRFRGIDCDCYTTFISTVLSNLNIPHTLRIAKYDPLGRFQHIYPIVPLSDGSYITVDCVLNEFNKEQPYVEIKDTIMDLEFLDGIEDEKINGTGDDDLMLGLEDIYGLDDLYGDDELGFSFKKMFNKVKSIVPKIDIKKGLQKFGNYAGDKLKKGWEGAGNIAKKGLHYLNKLNPATVLLRNGLLAAMKLNMFNVAGNLKWSYLSDQEAAKRGINQSKFNSLKGIKTKLESIFNMAGGEESNLKKAILTGNGNKNREVAGLDGIEDSDFFGLDGMDETTPLSQLLGPDIFYSENLLSGEELQGLRELEELTGIEIEGLNGLDDGEPLVGLGEPATVSIAAASGAMATIAALIKNVGNIFDSGKKIVDTGKSVVSTVMPSGGGSSSSPAQDYQPSPSPSPQNETDSFTPPAPTPTDSNSPESNDNNENGSGQPSQRIAISTPQTTALTLTQNNTPATTNSAAPAAPQQGFWDKNKTWLKPTLIGVAGLGAVYLGYRVVSGNSKPKKQTDAGLSGVNQTKSRGRPKGKKKGKSKRKTITKIKLS